MSITVVRGKVQIRRPIIVAAEGRYLDQLPYIRKCRDDPTSVGDGALVASNTLDEVEFAKRGWHVLGPAWSMSDLTPSERVELCDLVDTPRRDQTAEDRERESALLERCKRHTFSGCYDIDVATSHKDDTPFTPEETAAAHQLAEKLAGLIRDEERRRGVVLRESFSSGAPGPRRHMEWGTPEVGHVHLLWAGLARARDVCLTVGLKEVSANMFALPGTNPDLGKVDLVNLNRDPARRDSVLRPLGGLYKDKVRKKELCPGSPREGTPFSKAMLEDGLRRHNLHEGAPLTKKRAGRRVFKPIPVGKQGRLTHAQAVVAKWHPGHSVSGHELHLALAGTLLSTGFLSRESVMGIVCATATNDVQYQDARVSVESTLMNLQQRSPVTGAPKLRAIVGSAELFKLAQALALDTKKALIFVWGAITTKRKNAAGDMIKSKDAVLREEAAKMLEAVKALEVKATDHADETVRTTVHRVRRRLQSSTACGERRVDSNCPGCRGLRCQKHLYCSDPSCNACTIRKVQDVHDAMELPASSAVAVVGGFESKKQASKAYGKMSRRGAARPLATYTITADGTWEMTLACDQSDRGGVDDLVAFAKDWHGTVHEHQQKHQVRDFVTRHVLQKHVTARLAVEQGDLRALDLLVETYKKHVASSNDSSIRWPSKKDMQEIRKAKVKEKAPDDPDACPCPDEYVELNPAVHSVHNTRTGEVVIEDLASPPTLAMVVAYELGERIKMHRRKRSFLMSRRMAAAQPKHAQPTAPE